MIQMRPAPSLAVRWSPALLRAQHLLELIAQWIGWIAAIALLLLMVNVVYDVVMRYVFNDVSIGMQELEWHLYSVVFLLGIAYAFGVDGHVRVDIFYERMPTARRALVDILGTLLLVWPFCVLIALYGFQFAQESLLLGEKSGDPGGLHWRWLIKSVIPLAAVCVLLSSLGFMLRALNEALGLTTAHRYDASIP